MTFLKKTKKRGSATVAVLLVVVVLLGVTGAMLSMTVGVNKERDAAGAKLRAFTAANSAISHTVANMMAGTAPVNSSLSKTNVNVKGLSANLGVNFSSTYYWSNVIDNGDNTYTVTASGFSAGVTQAIQVLVVANPGGVFDNALFAGNTDGDPLYTLEFGGVGPDADDIRGDVYSGGSIDVSGDASITGTIRANGSIVGAPGESNVTQQVLDLDGMNYEATADFNVVDLFGAEGTYASAAAGGSAWQVPESNPAHILRKNPSDRSSNTASTVKDDYFLEDPYEPVGVDSAQDGSDAYQLTFSGVGNEPGPSSTRKVFYIDGNLWIHNRRSYSFKIGSGDQDGLQVTFIVKGNIYIADNVFYDNPDKDGVAFIAMKDSQVEDSGNIFFGDPLFGTLNEMHGFMFAENNFYDTNLSTSGSETVSLYGNMTAGNQVLIDRNSGSIRTKLVVDFDDRISSGDLDMPGLPSTGTAGDGSYLVQSWQRITAP